MSAESAVALVIGDLTLDVHTGVSITREEIASLAHGADVSAKSAISILPGGTAWLFADALASSSTVVPIIAASVGDDWAGAVLSSALRERRFLEHGLVRVPGEHSDLINTVSFNGQGRFMAWPHSKVSHKVYAWEWSRLQRLFLPPEIRFAWVSGYLLDDPDPSVLKHVQTLFDNLRQRRIPVVLDLVPHNFATSIGPLEQLEREVGPVDVLVGEFGTMADLGFGQRPAVGEDAKPQMVRCARSAAMGRTGAVVQHRIGNLYAQAIAGVEREYFTSLPVPASGPRGIGDTLAVEALRALQLVDLCLSSRPVIGSGQLRGHRGRVTVAEVFEDLERLGPEHTGSSLVTVTLFNVGPSVKRTSHPPPV